MLAGLEVDERERERERERDGVIDGIRWIDASESLLSLTLDRINQGTDAEFATNATRRNK